MALAIMGGAGADGKTTILELVAKYMSGEGRAPLLIDANPDQNLAGFFGLPPQQESALPKICENWTLIRDALEGGNADYPHKDHIVDTSPLTRNSKLWNPQDAADPLTEALSTLHDGIRFMRTGTYEAKDIGSGCLHDKIGALTFLLNHMAPDAGDKPVFVDNAHGRDAFGTPLYAAGDIVLLVARPEKKSLDIMQDYLSLARQVENDIGHRIEIAVIGNRFSNDPAIFSAQEKIFRELAGDNFLTALRSDEALDRGLNAELAALVRRGFNVAASDGKTLLQQIDFSNEGPRLDQLSSENVAAIGRIAEAVTDASHVPERKKEWIQLCLGRAEYLDRLVDPAVRRQRSDFVPDRADHVHGPHCTHHHHNH
jgi:CO dehydrogenase maturation factor